MKNSQLFIMLLGVFLSACSVDSSLSDKGDSSGSSQDPVGPKATINSELEGTTADPQIPVSITFTEDVTGFEAGDLIVSEGSISNFTGSGRTYSFTLNMVSDAAVTIRIPEGAATGVSGRPNQAVVQLIVGFVPSATTAVLSSLPASISNQTVLAIGVAGSGVTSYHYKLGESASTDCSVSTGYSVSIGEEVDITNDISSLSEGELRLCVIGLSEHSQQSYASATTYSWTKDTIAPSITGLANDNTWAKSKTWNWECDEVCTVAYTIDDSALSDAGSSYSSETSVIQDSVTGRYYLHIKAKDVAGNESSTLHVYAEFDNTIPAAIGSVVDGIYSNSLTQSPTLSWGASSDSAHSGFSHYEYAIGSAPGETDIKNWTIEAGTSAQVLGLNLSSGSSYYASVRVVDVAGNRSLPALSDGWLVDTVAPGIVSSLDDNASDGSLSQSPTFSWSAATDALSGISSYELAIGTSSGATDLVGWKNIGSTLSFQETGLSLIADTDYYVSVRSRDGAGNTGAVVTSDGWQISAPAFPCLDAPSVGTICNDSGVVYLGSHNELEYLTTPGGCEDSTNPSCSGSDYVEKSFDGSKAYCEAMSYGGYSDWELPDFDVLNLLWSTPGTIPGVVNDASRKYYSSTSGAVCFYGSCSNYWRIRQSTDGSSVDIYNPEEVHTVRCVRKYNPDPAVPKEFKFTNLSGIAPLATATSEILAITDIGQSVAVTISGDGSPRYRVCDDITCSADPAWTSAAGQIGPNQFLQLQTTMGSYSWSTQEVTINVASVSDTWTVTDIPEDERAPLLAAAPANISTMHVTYPSNSSNWQTITITNSGSAVTPTLSTMITGLNIEFRNDNCASQVLSMGESCTIEVRNKDVFVNGDLGGQVVVTGSGGLSTQAVLTGVASGFGADPCAGSPTPGTVCSGTTIYIGTFNGNDYMATPANCTDEANPSCLGGTDLTKKWDLAAPYVTTGANSMTNGWSNTNTLTSVGGYPAAEYCANLTYGGYSNWFLPAKDELSFMFQNAADIPDFSGYYWSSTEAYPSTAHLRSRLSEQVYNKGSLYRVRCVRSY